MMAALAFACDALSDRRGNSPQSRLERRRAPVEGGFMQSANR